MKAKCKTKTAPMKLERKNEIVVYQPDEVMRLEVRVLDESVWLTQAQIAELFGTKRPAITKHLANIYKTGELEKDGTCSILEHMGHAGSQQYRTAYYNLDAILAVGYRVNSREATQFRRWASSVLKEYLLRGYAFNARMNQLEDKVDRRFAKHDADIIDLKEKVDFFVQTSQPPVQGVFYNGQVFDAHVFAAKHILSAKKSTVPHASPNAGCRSNSLSVPSMGPSRRRRSSSRSRFTYSSTCLLSSDDRLSSSELTR